MNKLENKILNRLLYEFEHHIRNELYSMCQFKLASRSNQIEGNTMTEEDTAMLFDTQQIPSTEYKAKEIEEAQGHFFMFNQMLKTIKEPLNEDIIKSYHKEMTQGIFEFKANGGVPGEFKTRKNIAGNTETIDPNKVKVELMNLSNEYNEKKVHNLKDLAMFHVRYEKIHPFQDYNGRTGRVILFRESLILGKPIVINPKDRIEYIKSVKYSQDNNFDTSMLEKNLLKWQNEFEEEVKRII